jgi:PTS system mannitol-specific IIA component
MSDILTPQTIELKASLDSQEEAIRRAGTLLVENGHVEERYIDSMFEREKSVSTFMGNAVAIPHGTGDSKQWITTSGLSIITVPEGNVARLVIGIAGKGDEHLEILSKIATVCEDEDNVNQIVHSETKEELLSYFEEVEEVG